MAHSANIVNKNDLTIIIEGNSAKDISVYLGRNRIGGFPRFSFKASADQSVPYLDICFRFILVNKHLPLIRRKFLPDTMTIVVKDFLQINTNNSVVMNAPQIAFVAVGGEAVGMIRDFFVSADAEKDNVDICIKMSDPCLPYKIRSIEIARKKLLSLSWIKGVI